MQVPSQQSQQCHPLQLRKQLSRPIITPNLHITWVFLGEVEEANVPAVQKQLRAEVEFLKRGAGTEAAALTVVRQHKKYSPGALGKKISIDVDYDFIEVWPSQRGGSRNAGARRCGTHAEPLANPTA